MNFLERLSSGLPLFEAIPPISQKRICSTESEYGVENDDSGNPILTFFWESLPLWNGGEIYPDLDHIEYAAPESSNPLSATIYYEAGKIISVAHKLSPRLYCNNNDWYGNTFGAHENYFTCAPREAWKKLIPFLVARTIYCGSGWLNGEHAFEISQRAHHIKLPMGTETEFNRSIINLRDEPLSRIKGWERLHLICGDAGMSEMTTFLRIGTTSLVVELLEKNALPEIEYDYEYSPHDIHLISKSHSNWKLRGIKIGPRKATEILGLYLESAQKQFLGRDLVTDALLEIWADTLEKLERDPMLLWKRIDWVAKFTLLQNFEDREALVTPEWLQSQDMEYHNLDRSKGLYYLLRPQMERVAADSLIREATVEPPRDTRAYIRGKLSKFLAEEGDHFSLAGNSWDKIYVIRKEGTLHERELQREQPLYARRVVRNPLRTYEELLERVKKTFSTDCERSVLHKPPLPLSSDAWDEP